MIWCLNYPKKIIAIYGWLNSNMILKADLLFNWNYRRRYLMLKILYINKFKLIVISIF